MSVFRDDLYAGKHVLITGGATGIGFGIAQAFAAHGARVTIVSRNEERLEAACAKIRESGGEAAWGSADVRDPEALQKIAKEVGPVDVLINAAAGNFPTPFSAMSHNAWQSVQDIVVGGTVHATRAFGEPMMGRGGSIINIVAGYAWTGAPGVSHSGAAKAAVLNLTKSLAVEWAPSVRVNAVSPGPIGGTEGMKRLGEDMGLADAVVKGTPLARMGDADDIASACLYLASEAADYVTGSCLVVDGGQDAIGPFGMMFQAMRDA